MNRGIRHGLLLCAASLVFATAIWRSGLFHGQGSSASAHFIAEGKRTYETVDLAAIALARSPAELREILETATVGEVDAKSRKLLDELAAFLYYRFVQDSVADYKAWRRSAGHRLLDESEIWGIHRDYRTVFREPPPTDSDVETFFDRFWQAAFDLHPGSRIVAVAVEPRGFCITTGVLTTAAPNSWPKAECELSSDLWYGRKRSAMRRWWRGTRTPSELLDRYGRVEVAIVSFVAGGADGARRPYHCGYAWDPWHESWTLESVESANFEGTLSALEF